MIAVLALLSALGPLAIDMYLPAFPEMATDLGTSAPSIQLTLTAVLFGLAFGQLVIGPLSDRTGRRTPLLVGTLACLAASVLCALAPSVGLLIVARFVQGFTGAAGVVVARAVIADRTTGSDAARLFAIMMAISSLAPVLAPLLGGGILAFADWRAVFWFLALVNLLMFAGVLAFIPESLPAERRHDGGFGELARTLGSVLRNRVYLGYALTMGFTSMVLFGYISASPFVVQDIMGFSEGAYALTFALISVCIAVASAASSRLVRRVSPHRVLVAGLACLLTGTFLLLILVTVGGVPTWPTIAVLMLTVGSIGLIFGNAVSLGIGEVRHVAGTGSAVIGAMQFTFGALASPLVGLAGADTAWPMGVTLFAAAVLAALSLAVLTRRRPASAAPHPQ